MSITRLPSGRYRAQVYHRGANVSVSRVLGGPGTFATKREAKAAREQARAMLDAQRPGAITVAQWRQRWLSDPLYRRPKQSTMIHLRERTKAFALEHADLPLDQVDDVIVAKWIAGGRMVSTVPALRAMFSDAASAKAGRLIAHNPWLGLGLPRTVGNRDRTPPSEAQVWGMIRAARKHTCPSFAAWLQVAAFTGLRPGELDALHWDDLDLERYRAHIARQFNAKTRTMSAPKNGKPRDAILTPPAREAIEGLPREGAYVFRPPVRGEHYRPTTRNYHWRATRAAADVTGSLYLWTRHFAGSYMVNVLHLASEDVAIALGHTDGGQLVRTLYGHRDRELALDRVATAFEQRSNVRPLRPMEDAG